MPRKKKTQQSIFSTLKKVKLSTYVIGFTILCVVYFTYRYRHGINYYFSIIEKSLKGEKLTDDKVTKYDIRNIEVMDKYYLKTFGVDVSHYQGKIDWTKMHTIYNLYPINFAFIRSTMGTSSIDETFEDNWEGAKENNILRGAYHFYRPDENSTLQAQNFIATVPNKPDALPPVMDLEYDSNCINTHTKEQLLKQIQIMHDQLRSHYDKQPIFYTSKAFYNIVLLGEFKNTPIWIREYKEQPNLKDGRKWTFWQHNNQGKISGIEKPVDLNVFYADAQAWQQFLKKSQIIQQ